MFFYWFVAEPLVQIALSFKLVNSQIGSSKTEEETEHEDFKPVLDGTFVIKFHDGIRQIEVCGKQYHVYICAFDFK